MARLVPNEACRKRFPGVLALDPESLGRLVRHLDPLSRDITGGKAPERRGGPVMAAAAVALAAGWALENRKELVEVTAEGLSRRATGELRGTAVGRVLFDDPLPDLRLSPGIRGDVREPRVELVQTPAEQEARSWLARDDEALGTAVQFAALNTVSTMAERMEELSPDVLPEAFMFISLLDATLGEGAEIEIPEGLLSARGVALPGCAVSLAVTPPERDDPAEGDEPGR
jgi:hypothetical protein